MVTIDRRTNPSQAQTATVQTRLERMTAETSAPDGWRLEDWFNRAADPELTKHLVGSFGRRLVSSIAWIDLFENQGMVLRGFGATGAERNTRHESLKREVYSLLSNAGKENWDGEGALALSEQTVTIAMDLVDRFPQYTATPEVAATPHGEVDFDWVVDRESMLTVSVCPTGEIAFAGLFRGARLNGSETWSGVLPHFVHCCLERINDAKSA